MGDGRKDTGEVDMAEKEIGSQLDESNGENGMVGGMIEVGNSNTDVDNDVDKECV